MIDEVFFNDLLNAEFPNDKNKTLLEAILRFIKEEITEENINALGCYGGYSTFSATLYALFLGHQKLSDEDITNVIIALINKKPKIDQKALVLAMRSPVILDAFLKQIPPEEKKILLDTKLLSTANTIQEKCFVNPETIRILINHGLSVKELTASLKNFTLNSFVKSATSLSLKNFTVPDSADSKEYAEFYGSEFIKTRDEIIRRIRLALIFPSTAQKFCQLNGISFERDGACYCDMFNYFQESFKNYSSFKNPIENKALQDCFPDISKRKLIFEEVSKILLGNQKEGNRIIPVRTRRLDGFVGNTGGHAEGLLIFDDLLMKINRGARSIDQQSGITIFQKSSATTESETETFFSRLSASTSIDGNQFDQEIEKIVIKPHLLTLLMKDQKTGNCTWATSKAFAQATYFAVIRKHLKENNPEENEDSINKKASSISKSMYKEFSMAHRAQEIKNYIDIHIKENFKFSDKEILKKMIIYTFKLKEVEILEKIKGNKELCDFMQENKKEFLLAAIGNDDLDFTHFTLKNYKTEKLDEKLTEEILKTAIGKNALKIIGQLEELIGPLTNAKINDKHPLYYSIFSIIWSSNSEDTTIALLKNYSPIPYEEINKAAIDTRNTARMFCKEDKEKMDKVFSDIQIIENFCLNQLITESKNETLKILAKDIDPSIKIEEITAFRDKQKAILKKLTFGLPDGEEHEKILEPFFDATIQAVSKDSTAMLMHFKQPANTSTPPDTESTAVTIHKKMLS